MSTMTDEAPATAVERYTGPAIEEYRPRILMDADEAKALDQGLRNAMRAVLVEGTDYGTIPGTSDRNVLLKPGAEKLLQWFGFGFTNSVSETDRDSDGRKTGVTYRCTVTKGLADGRKVEVATCDGYAGYDEDRYYTSAEQARAKAEKRERNYARKDSRAPKPEKWENAEEYKAPWNTVIKMAQKRALVGAAIDATGAAGLFTQDLEDEVAAAVASAELAEAGRAAIEALPEGVAPKLNEWYQAQKWPDPGKWDTAQWCAALVEAGRLTALRNLGARLAEDQADDEAASQRAAAAPAARQERPLAGSWYDSVLERAATVTEATYKALWSELSDGQKAGRCTPEQRKEAEALIAARIDDLRNGRASDGDGAIEGKVVSGPPSSGLPAEDPWAAKVEEIASSEDAKAAIADVVLQHKNHTLTTPRKDEIIAAIRAREAALASGRAA